MILSGLNAISLLANNNNNNNNNNNDNDNDNNNNNVQINEANTMGMIKDPMNSINLPPSPAGREILNHRRYRRQFTYNNNTNAGIKQNITFQKVEPKLMRQILYPLAADAFIIFHYFARFGQQQQNFPNMNDNSSIGAHSAFNCLPVLLCKSNQRARIRLNELLSDIFLSSHVRQRTKRGNKDVKLMTAINHSKDVKWKIDQSIHILSEVISIAFAQQWVKFLSLNMGVNSGSRKCNEDKGKLLLQKLLKASKMGLKDDVNRRMRGKKCDLFNVREENQEWCNKINVEITLKKKQVSSYWFRYNVKQ